MIGKIRRTGDFSLDAFHENVIFNQDLPVKVFLHTDITWRRKLVLSHWHNSIEICFIVKGHPGTSIINGKSYDLAPHHLYVIGPNIIHSFDTIVTNKKEILTILIPLNWLSNQIDYFNHVHFKVGPLDLDDPAYKSLRKAMDQIVAYKREKTVDTILQLNTIGSLHYLAAFVLTETSSIVPDPSSSVELSAPLMIQSVMQKIQQQYQENLTIEQLSEENHVSEAYLIRVFKKYVGYSPKSYWIQTRLNQAKILLTQTAKTINEIAEETGFGSTKNFFVLFKKHFQMTPKEYRLSKQISE